MEWEDKAVRLQKKWPDSKMKFCATKEKAYQFLNKYYSETDTDFLTDLGLKSFIHPDFES